MSSQYPSVQSFFRKEVKGDCGLSDLGAVGEQRGVGNGNGKGDGFDRDCGGGRIWGGGGGDEESDGAARNGKDEKDELGDGFTVSAYEKLTGLVCFVQFVSILTFLLYLWIVYSEGLKGGINKCLEFCAI